MSEPPLVERLVHLFGPHWQAALDHAGVLSRRRGREIGAGADPTPLMLAVVELLESCPRAHWPDRWRRVVDRFPGKVSDTCPTLLAFAERLHPDGRIDPRDAVFVWDRIQEGDDYRNVNVAVGMLPIALQARPASDPIHGKWRRWNEQWESAHGGAMLNDWLEEDRATPEGVLAGWIAWDLLRKSDIGPTLQEAERRIFGFDIHRVGELERQIRARPEPETEEEVPEVRSATISLRRGRPRISERAGRSTISRD